MDGGRVPLLWKNLSAHHQKGATKEKQPSRELARPARENEIAVVRSVKILKPDLA